MYVQKLMRKPVIELLRDLLFKETRVTAFYEIVNRKKSKRWYIKINE